MSPSNILFTLPWLLSLVPLATGQVPLKCPAPVHFAAVDGGQLKDHFFHTYAKTVVDCAQKCFASQFCFSASFTPVPGAREHNCLFSYQKRPMCMLNVLRTDYPDNSKQTLIECLRCPEGGQKGEPKGSTVGVGTGSTPSAGGTTGEPSEVTNIPGISTEPPPNGNGTIGVQTGKPGTGTTAAIGPKASTVTQGPVLSTEGGSTNGGLPTGYPGSLPPLETTIGAIGITGGQSSSASLPFGTSTPPIPGIFTSSEGSVEITPGIAQTEQPTTAAVSPGPNGSGSTGGQSKLPGLSTSAPGLPSGSAIPTAGLPSASTESQPNVSGIPTNQPAISTVPSGATTTAGPPNPFGNSGSTIPTLNGSPSTDSSAGSSTVNGISAGPAFPTAGGLTEPNLPGQTTESSYGGIPTLRFTGASAGVTVPSGISPSSVAGLPGILAGVTTTASIVLPGSIAPTIGSESTNLPSVESPTGVSNPGPVVPGASDATASAGLVTPTAQPGLNVDITGGVSVNTDASTRMIVVTGLPPSAFLTLTPSNTIEPNSVGSTVTTANVIPPGVPTLSPGSPPGLSTVISGIQPGLSTVSPGNLPGLTTVSPGNPPGLSTVNPGNPPDLPTVNPVNPPGLSTVSPGNPPGISTLSPGNQPGLSSVNPGNLPGLPTVSSGSLPGLSTVNPGNPSDLPTLSPGNPPDLPTLSPGNPSGSSTSNPSGLLSVPETPSSTEASSLATTANGGGVSSPGLSVSTTAKPILIGVSTNVVVSGVTNQPALSTSVSSELPFGSVQPTGLVLPSVPTILQPVETAVPTTALPGIGGTTETTIPSAPAKNVTLEPGIAESVKTTPAGSTSQLLVSEQTISTAPSIGGIGSSNIPEPILPIGGGITPVPGGAPCTDRSVKKLTETERTMGLRSFLDKGWVLSSSSDSITKVFEFKDFNEAIGFVTRVALKAESIGHYPELHSSEKRVTVTLSSKEVGGLSTADITLAQFIESIAEKNKVSTPLSKAIRFPRLRVL